MTTTAPVRALRASLDDQYEALPTGAGCAVGQAVRVSIPEVL